MENLINFLLGDTDKEKILEITSGKHDLFNIGHTHWLLLDEENRENLNGCIQEFKNNAYDVVFCTSIMRQLDWMMGELTRITARYLIIVEERNKNLKELDRMIESLGWQMVCELEKQEHGGRHYSVRVFGK